MMIATVMTEANICRPLLSNILPMTLVAVTCKTPIEHTVRSGVVESITYKSRIRENKRPPRHLERQMMAGKRVFPQCADANNEEPHGKSPEPEADENADDFDDSGKLRVVKKVWRYYQVCLAAELS